MPKLWWLAAWASLGWASLCAAPAAPAAERPLALEALTSPELRERIASGDTTVLVPIGGTEQNGGHMALGKHNQRAALLAQRIAERLGHTLVAPVVAYVPEGAIAPPQAHMRYAGTLSVPEPAFEAMLVATAQSLCQHGFREVVLLGDHGGYQRNLAQVVARLERERPKSRWPSCRTHVLGEYYDAAQNAYPALLRAKGFSADEIGVHAGLADTSLTLALDPSLVRAEMLGRPPRAGEREGVQGDPRRATAELGQLGVSLIVDTTVAAIRQRLQARP